MKPGLCARCGRLTADPKTGVCLEAKLTECVQLAAVRALNRIGAALENLVDQVRR